MKNSRLIAARGSCTQTEFATALSVHKNTVARYESGEREPDGAYLRALMALGWNANWILTGEGPERLDTPQPATGAASQPMRLDEGTLAQAVALVMGLLEGRGDLSPSDFGQAVAAFYDAITQQSSPPDALAGKVVEISRFVAQRAK